MYLEIAQTFMTLVFIYSFCKVALIVQRKLDLTLIELRYKKKLVEALKDSLEEQKKQFKLFDKFSKINDDAFEFTISNENIKEGDLVELIIKPNGDKEVKKVKEEKEK